MEKGRKGEGREGGGCVMAFGDGRPSLPAVSDDISTLKNVLKYKYKVFIK